MQNNTTRKFASFPEYLFPFFLKDPEQELSAELSSLGANPVHSQATRDLETCKTEYTARGHLNFMHPNSRQRSERE
jgi:hypothetical protein